MPLTAQRQVEQARKAWLPRKTMIRELQIPGKRNYWIAKRTFSILISAGVLLVLSPLYLLIALLIVLDDPKGGPFYSSYRCGRGGRPFKMYKFRSMKVGADKMLKDLMDQNEMSGPVFKMKNDPRITRVGKLLRKTSLDELPQFFNVLLGDMAIVGPRPPLPDEVSRYTEYQYQRLYITPGMTCFWQIAPRRNEISFDDWVEMDIRYVVERSLWVDLKIILMTVPAVLNKHGE